jgi:ABC-type lipoprotein export system ATPase subunit
MSQRILLADEPTSSLDKNTEIVIELLKSLSKEYKAALIIVTHDGRIKEKFPQPNYNDMIEISGETFGLNHKLFEHHFIDVK